MKSQTSAPPPATRAHLAHSPAPVMHKLPGPRRAGFLYTGAEDTNSAVQTSNESEWPLHKISLPSRILPHTNFPPPSILVPWMGARRAGGRATTQHYHFGVVGYQDRSQNFLGGRLPGIRKIFLVLDTANSMAELGEILDMLSVFQTVASWVKIRCTSIYRSSQNYYRQSCYSWEYISQKYRHRYRLEIRMNSFNYDYRYRLGVCSDPFIFIDSQLPSWKSLELIC